MKGLIVSSGSIEDLEQLKMEYTKSDYVICADGGVNYLMKINSLPHMVLGDLDSTNKDGLEFIKRYNIPIEKYPSKKDETDTELAIHHLLERDIKDITLMGVTGSRIDHSLANVFLLREIYNKGARAKIINANNIVYYIRDFLELDKKENHYVSVIPLTIEGITVSLEGFLYPLCKKYIQFSSTIGISNEILEEKGLIYIHKGEALVIESRD